jgi:hypothetical protein
MTILSLTLGNCADISDTDICTDLMWKFARNGHTL